MRAITIFPFPRNPLGKNNKYKTWIQFSVLSIFSKKKCFLFTKINIINQSSLIQIGSSFEYGKLN